MYVHNKVAPSGLLSCCCNQQFLPATVATYSSCDAAVRRAEMLQLLAALCHWLPHSVEHD